MTAATEHNAEHASQAVRNVCVKHPGIRERIMGGRFPDAVERKRQKNIPAVEQRALSKSLGRSTGRTEPAPKPRAEDARCARAFNQKHMPINVGIDSARKDFAPSNVRIKGLGSVLEGLGFRV